MPLKLLSVPGIQEAAARWAPAPPLEQTYDAGPAPQSPPDAPPPLPDAPAPPGAPPVGAYGPDVERWRGDLAREFKARGLSDDDVNKAMYVINGESGGNPTAANPESSARGLVQMTDVHGIPESQRFDPQFSIKWMADQVKSHGWTDWGGDGATYEGKPYGILGLKPYEGGSAGAVGNSALATIPGAQTGGATALDRYTQSLAQQDANTGDVPAAAGGRTKAGLEDVPLGTRGTLRGRLMGVDNQPDMGSVPVRPQGDTESPLTTLGRASAPWGIAGDALTPPVVGDALQSAADTVAKTPSLHLLDRLGVHSIAGHELPTAGEVLSSAVPTNVLDAAVTLAPLVGEGGKAVDATRLLTSEGAARAGASSTLDRLLPARVLADERRGANIAEALGGSRTQGAKLGQKYGPEIAGGPAGIPAPPVSAAARVSQPLPELGDRGIQEALAAKKEATLDPGRIFGEEGSLQRKVVGALNPSVDISQEVHVANQARTGVRSVLRSELSRAEVPAYRNLAETFEAEAPRYTGPANRPLANTWVDYAENPRLYDASPTLTAAKEELRAVQDASLGRVRESFGVDIGRFEAGHDPEAVYVPHVAARDQGTTAIASTEKSISSRGSVAKERAYDSLSDRVAKHPDWKPELDPAVLADNHASALASMAANNTFKAGVNGKTLTEVIDETHPGLRDARDKIAQRVQTVKAKIDLAEQRIGESDATLGPLVKEQMAIDQRATPKFVAVSEADKLTPELKTMQTQLGELRMRARAIDKAVTRAQGKGAAADLRMNDALSELGQLEPRLAELRTRYNTAAPGDYVRGPDFRYHDPKTAEAMHSVLKQGFDNAFIDTAIDYGNRARAAGLGPDASPLTIQGALGAFSHPEVAIKNGAGLAHAFTASPEEFARMVNPEVVSRFEFASGHRVGAMTEDVLGNQGLALPKGRRFIANFNQRLQQVVDYGTLKAFENDSNLLMKLGQESQNIADHEAANSISKIIPRMNNAETGRSVQRVKLEGVLPTSRSFTAQPFALAKDYGSGVAKIVTGRPGELLGREKLALIRGSSLLGTALTISVGSALVSAEANGKDPIEAVKEVIDPSSGRFLHVILGNKGSIGLGGPFRSAFLGVFRTATQGPAGAVKYARGRLQPEVGAAVDIATNTDWKGDPVRTGSGWHQVLQSVEHLARSFNLTTGGIAQGVEEGGLSGAADQAISGLGGVNYQERTAYDERDRAAREKFGQPYNQLAPPDRATIDALGLAPKSPFSKRSEEMQAPIVAEQKRVEALFAQGNLDKRLPEYYHDLGQRKLQASHDYETQFAKDFEGFDKTKYRTAVDGYFSIDKKNDVGSPDFDATEAARQDYLAALPDDERKWVEGTLQVSKENQTPLRKEYLTYIDAKKKAGYFKDGITGKERTALDAAHSDLDLQSWYFNGGVKDKSGGQLNSKDAVDQALQMVDSRGLKGRAVQINGADRDYALPENRQFWQDNGSLIANFTGDAYSKKYGDQEAQLQYARGNVKSPRYADLSSGEKSEVDADIRRKVKEGSPELEAKLAYAGVGGNSTDKVYAVSTAAVPFVTELNKKYGKTSPKDGWQIVQRR